MFPFQRLLCRMKMPIQSQRDISTSLRVMSQQEWQQYGVPGSNLPFSIKNKYLLTLKFGLFFGTALTAPFLIGRRHLILMNSKTAEIPAQQLTTIICFDEAEK